MALSFLPLVATLQLQSNFKTKVKRENALKDASKVPELTNLSQQQEHASQASDSFVSTVVRTSPSLPGSPIDLNSLTSGQEIAENGTALVYAGMEWIGRFHSRLKPLKHPHLCRYIDLVQGEHGRFFLVSEHYPMASVEEVDDPRIIREWIRQILSALVYIHEHGIEHCSLSLDTIRMCNENCVKLTDYGISYLTKHGLDVEHPLQLPQFMAPESLLLNENLPGTSMKDKVFGKDDIWSLGIICLHWYRFWPKKLSDMTDLDELIQEIINFKLDDCLNDKSDIEHDALDFIRCCLRNVMHRPSAIQLLEHPFVKGEVVPQYSPTISCLSTIADEHLRVDYALWKLAGGEIGALFFKDQMEHQSTAEAMPKTSSFTRMPIQFVPNAVSIDRTVFQDQDYHEIFTNRRVLLDMDRIPNRMRQSSFLESINNVSSKFVGLWKSNHHASSKHLLSVTERFTAKSLLLSPNIWETYIHCLYDLPTVLLDTRERDLVYQMIRIHLFKALLEQNDELIFVEARLDVPRILTEHVWPKLLFVENYDVAVYSSIDKRSPQDIDRQLDVDIPRCHQYHPLIRSTPGQWKLKRMLKAWVAASHDMVYWQGLDSICAVFLVLYFAQESLSFACFHAFSRRFLKKYFVKDNSFWLQRMMHIHKILLAYHDPELFNHLTTIGFSPDLYAIPWFLTFFTHIFPINTIIKLWTTMLALPEPDAQFFNHHLAISILSRLRKRLLDGDFNDCMACFSDLASLQAGELLQDCLVLADLTPPIMLNMCADVDLVELDCVNMSVHDFLSCRSNWNLVIQSRAECSDSHLKGVTCVDDITSLSIDYPSERVVVYCKDKVFLQKALDVLIHKRQIRQVVHLVADCSFDENDLCQCKLSPDGQCLSTCI